MLRFKSIDLKINFSEPLKWKIVAARLGQSSTSVLQCVHVKIDENVTVRIDRKTKKKVLTAGLEPTTLRLLDSRANQLSHGTEI